MKGFFSVSVVKESAGNAQGIGDVCLIFRSGRFPWRRTWQPTPVFLPGEPHRLKSLADYSTYGCNESDIPEMTPALTNELLPNSLNMARAFNFIQLPLNYCTV